jgi:hypothetical protein
VGRLRCCIELRCARSTHKTYRAQLDLCPVRIASYVRPGPPKAACGTVSKHFLKMQPVLRNFDQGHTHQGYHIPPGGIGRCGEPVVTGNVF